MGLRRAHLDYLEQSNRIAKGRALNSAVNKPNLRSRDIAHKHGPTIRRNSLLWLPRQCTTAFSSR